MTTLDDVLNLLASHKQENQAVLEKLGYRMSEQEQELSKLLATYVVAENSTVSTKDMLNKIKVRDLQYWYTPLNKLSGYSDFGGLLRRRLIIMKIFHLGDLVTLTEEDLCGLSIGRKTLSHIKTWLSGLGEELGQELKEYRENQALLRHFDKKIIYREDGLFTTDSPQQESLRRITAVEIYTVGELATSHLVETMVPEGDLQGIENYLKQWDENLHLHMAQPYQPS